MEAVKKVGLFLQPRKIGGRDSADFARSFSVFAGKHKKIQHK
jgi:hypothetical protein